LSFGSFACWASSSGGSADRFGSNAESEVLKVIWFFLVSLAIEFSDWSLSKFPGFTFGISIITCWALSGIANDFVGFAWKGFMSGSLVKLHVIFFFLVSLAIEFSDWVLSEFPGFTFGVGFITSWSLGGIANHDDSIAWLGDVSGSLVKLHV